MGKWFDSTWLGRKVRAFLDFRERHPGWSLLFIPLDFILLSFVYVIPVLLGLCLASWIGTPAKALGGEDADVIILGFTVIAVAAFFIVRYIRKKNGNNR